MMRPWTEPVGDLTETLRAWHLMGAAPLSSTGDQAACLHALTHLMSATGDPCRNFWRAICSFIS